MSNRPSSLLYTSTSTSHSSSSSHLQTRINQKRLELENLRQLRDLSSQLATQMSTLEEKLSTLRDGTEAVAEVLRNWTGVLGVLEMVGGMMGRVVGDEKEEERGRLPGTLVRVPVERGREEGQQEREDEGNGGGERQAG